MLKFDFKAAKAGFFDREAVVKAIGKARHKVFSKFGAFVRQRAKTSIRKRKGSAPPGRPPHSHKGQLRRFISFAYDFGRGSVVIGPELIDRPTGAPETLEDGGSVAIERFAPVARTGRKATAAQATSFLRLVKAGRIKTKPRAKVKVRVGIKARPFMGPAFQAELPGLPAMWKDAVK